MDNPTHTKSILVEPDKPPIIEPGHTFGSVSDKIGSFVLTHRTPKGWWVGFGIGFIGVMLLGQTLANLLLRGTGIWGVTNPVGWGFDIINFVWWIGIGHAGTLISAILLLLRQEWRTSINRFAEAMTLFAVACAAMYPLFHTGRPWLAIYWLFPYPKYNGDLAAVPKPIDVGCVCGFDLRNGLVAVLVCRIDSRFGDLARPQPEADSTFHLRHAGHGLARFGPALEPLRNRLPAAGRTFHAARSIRAYHRQLRLRRRCDPWLARNDLSAILRGRCHLCGLCHGVDPGHSNPGVSTGWKTSSRCATLDNMAKIILVTGLIVSYGYMMEAFFGWYSANPYESFMILNRMKGPYATIYWLLIACNVLAPQAFWFKSMRASIPALFIVS
jgi:molybdopterin-containing oxidoreductase family membrane subunit